MKLLVIHTKNRDYSFTETEFKKKNTAQPKENCLVSIHSAHEAHFVHSMYQMNSSKKGLRKLLQICNVIVKLRERFKSF